MRTTIDLPDDLFRKTKAVAALRGSTMKELIIHAVERETAGVHGGKTKRRAGIFKLPAIRLKHGKKLDLTNFDFDDLLG